MITADNTHELMINPTTRELYKRALSKDEIWQVINAKYSDDQAGEKLYQLSRAGFTLDEIVDYALAEEK